MNNNEFINLLFKDITDNINSLKTNLELKNDLFIYKFSKILSDILQLNHDITDFIDEIPDIKNYNQDEINKIIREYREYDKIHENCINDITPLMLYYQITAKK